MSKFKKGDLVRVINDSYHGNAKEGTEFIIKKFFSSCKPLGPNGKGSEIFYNEDELELVKKADESLTAGQALDAFLEGKILVDEHGYTFSGSRYSLYHFMQKIRESRNGRFRILPECEMKKLEMITLSEPIILNDENVKIGLDVFSKQDALRIADFIIENYRGEND